MNFSIKFNILWDSIDEKLHHEEKGKSLRACIHSGNAGDIIYSLNTVRELGAEHFVINICSDPKFGGRNIDFKTARTLAPLLLVQPYIKRVTIVSSNLPLEYLNEPIEGIEFNLDKFRLQDVLNHHLSISHAKAFGLYLNLYEKWIFVDSDKQDRDYIVVSLTPRYRSLPKEFWLEALAGLDNVIVLGIPEEFYCLSGITADFMTCNDFLQMAKIIQGAKLFIGNANLPYAIAEGLKVQRIIEMNKEFQNAYPIGRSGYIAPHSVKEARDLIERLISDSPENLLQYQHKTMHRDLENLKVALKGKDAHIGNLGNHIKNIERILRDRDIHIDNLETYIKNLEEAIKKKDNHIENLEIYVRNLEEGIKCKDNHIGNLEEGIKCKDNHMANLEDIIREKDVNMINLESSLREKEDTLTHIYNSRGWKILLRYRRFKDKIFPQNSNRRLFVNFFSRVLLADIRDILKLSSKSHLNLKQPESEDTESCKEKKMSEAIETGDCGRKMPEPEVALPTEIHQESEMSFCESGQEGHAAVIPGDDGAGDTKPVVLPTNIIAADNLIAIQGDLFDGTRMKLVRDSRKRNARAAVFMPCGVGSIHEQWLTSIDRPWDMVAYCYDDTYVDSIPADIVYRRDGSFNGTKFSSFARLISDDPDFMEAYDYWMLMDNDILTTMDDIERLFHIMAEHKLDLAQPSLTDDSYCAWPILKQKNNSDLRYVNAVEIMSFMFSKQTLMHGIHLFHQSISGYGIDLAFGEIVRRKLGTKPAVIDAVAVRHTKKIDQLSGKFYTMLRDASISPMDELYHMQRLYKFDIRFFEI